MCPNRVSSSCLLALVLVGSLLSEADAQTDGPTDVVSLPMAEPDPSRADSDVDCDGLTDREERDRVYESSLRTDPTLWDSDLDGLPDGLEVGRSESRDPACPDVVLDTDATTRTSPVLADTDADGLSDGMEDRDGDGALEANETDPAAFDRSAHPGLPEPLLFDLVRGLGAARGELEANTLVVIGDDGLRVAPELEWAFAQGYAVELELPMHGTRLDAVKVALQGTIRRGSNGRFRHGWQLIGELEGHDRGRTAIATHVTSGRFARRGSFVVMLGAGVRSVSQGPVVGSVVVNASLFLALDTTTRVGLEAVTRTETVRSSVPEATLLPQVHVDISHHARIQAGLGAELGASRPSVLGASRVIVEF